MVPPLRAVAPSLRWTSYGGGLGDTVAWATVVGPGGWWAASEVAVGVLLQAPRRRYPAHLHPVDERYLVLAGEARLRVGDAERVVGPGSRSTHPAGLVHASTTGAAPLLALWTWLGPVGEPSRLADDDRLRETPALAQVPAA